MNLYKFGRAVARIASRLLYRVTITGQENIPARGGLILACNHRTNWDPIFLATGLARSMRFMAKSELFAIPLVGWVFPLINAFPVSRGKGDRQALITSREILEAGGMLVMFPEGKRSTDGNPLPPKSGVALIAGEAGAPVAPCSVFFEGRLRFRSRVTVRFGEPIPAGELGIDTASPASMRQASKEIMERICALLAQGHAESRGKGRK